MVKENRKNLRKGIPSVRKNNQVRKPNTECRTCGNSFYARPCDKKKGYGIYCSRECYLKDKNYES